MGLVLTFFSLMIILGATDKHAPAGYGTSGTWRQPSANCDVGVSPPARGLREPWRRTGNTGGHETKAGRDRGHPHGGPWVVLGVAWGFLGAAGAGPTRVLRGETSPSVATPSRRASSPTRLHPLVRSRAGQPRSTLTTMVPTTSAPTWSTWRGPGGPWRLMGFPGWCGGPPEAMTTSSARPEWTHRRNRQPTRSAPNEGAARTPLIAACAPCPSGPPRSRRGGAWPRWQGRRPRAMRASPPPAAISADCRTDNAPTAPPNGGGTSAYAKLGLVASGTRSSLPTLAACASTT